MAVKLWIIRFMRVYVANLPLFTSLHILFPVLSVEMADRLGVPVTQAGVIFLSFTLGIFFIGPFHAYLVDVYKHRYVCMFSFAMVVTTTAGCASVTNITEFILLSTVQGLAFGVTTTAGITLAIDIMNATLRNAGNVSLSWMARLKVIIGIVLGIWLYQSHSLKSLLSVSVVAGAAGALMVSGIYVPFRAPIVTKFCSFDRSLLLRGWVPAINMILTTFAPGLLIPPVHRFLNDSVSGSSGIPIPFFIDTNIGYLASPLLAHLFILKEKTPRPVLVGIILEIVAITLLTSGFPIDVPSVLLGLGLGLVVPEFLVMFVKLSHHCQRGTVNTAHPLANEVGFAPGIAITCYFDLKTDKMLYTGQTVAVIALIFFTLVIYPYYRRKKVK